MRILYIRFLSIFTALALCGCSDLAVQLKNPHSLSSRVGNYSPTRLNSDKGERRAQNQVTALKKGIRDLDGRQESYDPAFGSPDRGGDRTRVASGVSNVDFQSGSKSGNGQVARFDSIASDSTSTIAGQSNLASKNVTPINANAGTAQFGLSESGQPAQSFRTDPGRTPVVNTPQPVGNQNGFGCPPSGMTSLNNSIQQNPTLTPGGSGPSVNEARTAAQFTPQLTSPSPSISEPAAPKTPPFAGMFGGSPPVPAQPISADTQSFSAARTKDGDLIALQTQRANGVNVVVTARVKRLLPDDRQGNPHQRFLLDLSNGTTVLVAHNIDLAPYVPLHENDVVTICGEYIWNDRGGVIHYTHRATNYRHKGGYIDYNRQVYQ